jgi:TolB protein
MKKQFGVSLFLAAVAAATAFGQQPDVVIKILKNERAVMAIPDLRGAGESQRFMEVFNSTLWGDVQDSGLFKMAPKSFYPTEVPQRPQDFKPPLPAPAQRRRGGAPLQPIRQGPWLTDWSGPPVSANYLAMGYVAIQAEQLVLFGWLYDVGRPDISGAQVFGKVYFGTVNDDGARKIAREFAADILSQFGAKGLAGSKIYFVSDRTGRGMKEIWSMDYDGSNQKQVTSYRSISTMPAVSPDGTRLAFTSFYKTFPAIVIHSLETGRKLPFFNQIASMNATPDFTPDGKSLLFSSTLASRDAQIYMCDLAGGNLKRISMVRAIEVEPKANPRNGQEIAFVSGRSGRPQIYRMNLEGTDVERLTSGEGEAGNPAWHPGGRHLAFKWTRGYEPGNWNIFIMDVATRQFDQLTHGAGRNENPSWAPDGRHIVFSTNRTRSSQIWTMLADGTQLKQLTTQGNNTMPVWSKQ